VYGEETQGVKYTWLQVSFVGSFADIQGSFADIQGSFADIRGEKRM